MNEEKYENRKKDEILQQIHDAFEQYNWGANSERTVIKIIFTGKLEIRPIEVQSKLQ